jgi:hypothetical protein
MTALPYEAPVDGRSLPFKDRRTSLRVMGALLLTLGLFTGCMSAMTPVGMVMSAVATQQMAAQARARAAASQPAASQPAASQPATSAPTRQPTAVATSQPLSSLEIDYRGMFMGFLTYALAAAVFVWAGIASLRLRRSARPIVLITGWSWLLTGLMSVVYFAAAGLDMRAMMTQPGAPAPPAVAVKIATIAIGVFTFLTMVVIPALMVWFYHRRGVRETLAYFDQRHSWTDRCPTPVLAVSAWLLLMALGCASYSVFMVLPVFGRFVTGPLAVAGLFAMAGVMVWLALLVYRLRPAGWWGAVLVLIFWVGSMIWTFTHGPGYHEFYRAAGYSQRQIDQIMQYAGPWEDATVWMMAAWSAGFVGYLLYVRRYFHPQPAEH